MQEENFSIPKMNACHYASTPDGQLCFILALKVCEGVQDIAHNIYTSRLPPQDCCLNGPLGGPEVWREGTTAQRQPPACVCFYYMCANYSLTDREKGLTGHSCLADAMQKCFTLAWRPWPKMRLSSDGWLGPGPRRKILESRQWWEGGYEDVIGGDLGGLILHSFIQQEWQYDRQHMNIGDSLYGCLSVLNVNCL